MLFSGGVKYTGWEKNGDFRVIFDGHRRGGVCIDFENYSFIAISLT